MVHRISVESKNDSAAAERIFTVLKDRFPKSGLTSVLLSRAYTLDANLTTKALASMQETLTNRVIEQSSTTRVLSPATFSYALEIGFKPGVTDNVGNTCGQMLSEVLGRSLHAHEHVYSSKFVFLLGRVTASDAKAMAQELHNSLIEYAHPIPFTVWKNGRMAPTLSRVELSTPERVRAVPIDIPEEALLRLSKEGIENKDGTHRGPLALSLAELSAIGAYFKKKKRNPTDVELESIAQTWSEHCKHTIFADPLDDIQEGIYKRYIKGATERIRHKKGPKDFCVSVFKDNSGAIDFNGEYMITHKVETHNSPSALDPYGGAMTGIVGVNRDTLGFGLGAKPIANIYGFFVGEPTDKRPLFRDKEKTRQLLSPRRILSGVVRGIEGGGNQSGIPTPLGFVHTDDSYRGKPLVFAGTVGLLPRRSAGRDLAKKRAKAGDYIVMIGGRVGLDGVHGATFSSEALQSGSPATAVQIGDPITQKKLSDAIIRDLRDEALYSSITDNGAGGISCSVAEMAQECGGCLVDLKTVPLKYPGLAPWQIWISESQERMTLSVPKNKWLRLKKILDKHGVEATRIGTFTNSGACIVKYGTETVMDVELSFLHDGRPRKQLVSKKPKRVVSTFVSKASVRVLEQDVLQMLARPNIGSIAPISEQYDHEVQGMSVTKPLVGVGRVNVDAGVLKPLPDDDRGIVLSHGYTPTVSSIDPYAMAAGAIDTAVRNAVCAGAPLNHLAILDNFCWSSSNDPERLWELKEAARACYDYAVAYGTPFISGKDSMFNDFRGYNAKGQSEHIAALPTLLVSAIGVMKDARQAMTIDFKCAGDVVYLLGDTKLEFGGSEYARMKGQPFAGTAPQVDAKKNKALYETLNRALEKRLMASAIGLTRGGLASALSKSALAGGLGVEVKVSQKDLQTMLFSESQGRIVVSIAPEKVEAFESVMKKHPYTKIGKVVKEQTVRIAGGSVTLRFSLADLSRAYRTPFKTL